MRSRSLLLQMIRIAALASVLGACTASGPSPVDVATDDGSVVSSDTAANTVRPSSNANADKAAVQASSTNAADTAPPPGPDYETMYASLRENMVGHASIDGAPVTTVRPESKCAATIETREGPTRFDWKTSGDVNAYGEAGREVFPLQDSSGRKRLVSAPSGDAANGIMMTVSVLSGECSATAPD